MYFPTEIKVETEGKSGIMGITEFAQSELSEIMYVDLPAIGKKYTKDEVFVPMEAVKTNSDLFMPIGGTVIKVSAALKDPADLVNSEPHSNSWMIKIRISDPSDINSLHSAEGY